MRYRMTTGAAALAVLLLGACGPEEASREALLEPAADMAMTPASTATAVIEGRTYTYGCPDFPCPVLDIVTDHINRGLFFWMTPVEGRPRIYLPVLRTPVLLTLFTKPDTIFPPIVVEPEAPSLDGPTELRGDFVPPVNQLVCRDFTLELISPDLGPWRFVRGEMMLDYMKDSYEGWIPSGYTSLMPFGEDAWSQLLNGDYAIYSPFPSPPAYGVHFSVLVQRTVGDHPFEYTVEHEMMCGTDEYYEPKPPPEPRLTGPEMVKGKKYPDLGIVCRNFTLELRSEDEGQWDFVAGDMRLEYLKWRHDLRRWVPTGETTTRTLGPDMWWQLLHGTYVLKPANRHAMAYITTVSATVERMYRGQEWSFPVQHTFTCAGPEYYHGIEK